MNIYWKDWYWSWSSNTLATWCNELDHWKRPWCWGRLKGGGDAGDRGWDVNDIINAMDMSLSKLWEIVKDREAWCAVLQSMGSQRVRHDWATELNWTELNWHLHVAFYIPVYTILSNTPVFQRNSPAFVFRLFTCLLLPSTVISSLRWQWVVHLPYNVLKEFSLHNSSSIWEFWIRWLKGKYPESLPQVALRYVKMDKPNSLRTRTPFLFHKLGASIPRWECRLLSSISLQAGRG